MRRTAGKSLSFFFFLLIILLPALEPPFFFLAAPEMLLATRVDEEDVLRSPPEGTADGDEVTGPRFDLDECFSALINGNDSDPAL